MQEWIKLYVYDKFNGASSQKIEHDEYYSSQKNLMVKSDLCDFRAVSHCIC